MISMPLVVDLDGTLIRTDMLHESALRVLRESPGNALRIPLWLSRGKAVLKERLAGLVDIDPASLPYNAELLEWLKVQKSEGRKLILCRCRIEVLCDTAEGLPERLEIGC